MTANIEKQGVLLLVSENIFAIYFFVKTLKTVMNMKVK